MKSVGPRFLRDGFTPYHFSQKSSKGFTLIELLVVIAIIGILSAIVLASLQGAKAKGRDARRISDIKQLQLALELYYDANSYYPTVAQAPLASGSTLLTSAGYISVLPTDPSGGTAAYGYFAYPSSCSGTTCTGYIVGAKLEANNAALSNSYAGSGPVGDPFITINGSSNTYKCSQNTSPNFIYCGAP